MVTFFSQFQESVLKFFGFDSKDIEKTNQLKNNSTAIPVQQSNKESLDKFKDIKVLTYNEEDNDSDYFVDEAEKRLLHSFNNKQKPQSHTSSFNLSVIPLLYLITTIIYIPAVLLITSKTSTLNHYDVIGKSNFLFLNFYSSLNASPLLTNLVFNALGVLGIVISIASFSSMKRLLSSVCFFPNFKVKSLLFLFFVFSLTGFCLDVFTGISCLIPSSSSVDGRLLVKYGFSLLEIAVIAKSVILLLGVMCLLLAYWLSNDSIGFIGLNSGSNSNSNSNRMRSSISYGNSNSNSNSVGEEKKLYRKWVVYSVIAAFYTTAILVTYLVFKYIKFSNTGNSNSNSNDNTWGTFFVKISVYFVALLPYLLHVLVGLLVYCNNYLLKGCYLTLKHNIEEVVSKNRKFEL